MTPLIDGYYVTLCGRVFVKEREEWVSGRHPNPYFRTYPEKQIKVYYDKRGYGYVGLTINGKRGTYLVHRLVASAFIPTPANLPGVNHKNLDKSDNRVCNLEWCTRQSNLDHAVDNGVNRIGEKVGTSLLKEKGVIEIVKLLDEGVSQTAIGSMFNVSNHAIHRIAKGYNWSWLTKIGRKEGDE